MRRPRSHAVQKSRISATGKPVSNRLLLSIPDAEYLAIQPHLQFLRLAHRQVLHEPKGKLRSAYFLNVGLISTMIETREGRTVEVGVVGNEGLVGLGAVVGIGRSPLLEIVQIAGEGFSIEVPALQSSLRSMPVLQAILNRYFVLQGMQVAQTAACNRLHNVEQRFARWLLTLQARSKSDSLVITHDFLSSILGTDRPSVSLAAAHFQRGHMIEYSRGTVKILSRKKLARLACECYEVIEQLNADFENQ